MMKQHYYAKIQRYGIRKSIVIILKRFKALIKRKYWKYKALSNKSHHNTWQDIAHKNNITNRFEYYWHHTKATLKCASYVFNIISNKTIIDKAEQLLQNYGGFLGSDFINDDDPPWHEDTRLRLIEEENRFFPKFFSHDMAIVSGTTAALAKDVKLPWELSRGHYLVVWAQAYELTGEKKYSDAFTHHVSDWIQHNPVLIGVNWLCPMEVALRSINWIWTIHYFKKCEHIPLSFWENIVCSLYDHMIYLSNNWEIYDGRTNNHYMADLVGYLYLCWFFRDIPGIDAQAAWCYQLFLQECKKQIFLEGASYEGSTYYNNLMIELMYHGMFISQELRLPPFDDLLCKLRCMMEFADWCTPIKGTMIAIGDQDSGKVLFKNPLYNNVQNYSNNTYQIKQYADFGLSIYKTEDVHVSLRHHAYKFKQPSGHFHNDMGSVTFAYKGIPVIVDPGTYVYTASSYWRNHFRSVKNHSTLYIDDQEPVPFDERLFALELPENSVNNVQCPLACTKPCLYTTHTLYKRLGLQMHRHVSIQEKEIIITDWWEQVSDISAQKICWNFTLGPDIDVEQKNSSCVLLYQNKEIATIKSDLIFSVMDGWYSPEYGVKIPCKQLRTTTKLAIDTKFETKIILI